MVHAASLVLFLISGFIVGSVAGDALVGRRVSTADLVTQIVVSVVGLVAAYLFVFGQPLTNL
jgi:hypothetical protein